MTTPLKPMRFFLTALFFAISAITIAQSSKLPSLEVRKAYDKQLGHFSYYLATKNLQQEKPVLLFLEGSGCFPLLRIINDGQNCCIYINTISIDIDSLANYYHVILVNKPGVPLIDSMNVNTYENLNLNGIPCAETYTQKISFEWRTRAASIALTKALKEVKANRKKVIVMGNSEGGQVAPAVAASNKAVTHCINICGSGINQFYTPIIKTRLKARQGIISYEEAERQVDSLFAMYADIYKNKDATDKSWYGQTYQRWSSFTLNPPLEYYRKLSIPTYIAIGAKDENGDVLSADYIKLEFLRLGKNNLTYKVYPNYDHFFNEIAGKKKIAHSREAYDTALQWAADTL
jgi:pimeloyl-ACP methyl ester carboxylesterase